MKAAFDDEALIDDVERKYMLKKLWENKICCLRQKWKTLRYFNYIILIMLA